VAEKHLFEINLNNPKVLEKILDSSSGKPIISLLLAAAQKHEVIQTRIETLKAWHELWKSLIPMITVYSIGSLIVLSILWIVISTIANPKATADEKNWARTTIVSIVTGTAGFFFGKQDIEKQKVKEAEEKK